MKKYGAMGRILGRILDIGTSSIRHVKTFLSVWGALTLGVLNEFLR